MVDLHRLTKARRAESGSVRPVGDGVEGIAHWARGAVEGNAQAQGREARIGDGFFTVFRTHVYCVVRGELRTDGTATTSLRGNRAAAIDELERGVWRLR